MRLYFKKIFVRFAYFLLLIGTIIFIAFLFRQTILENVAQYLVVTQKPEKADAIFVFSGGAWERGRTAAELYTAGFASKIICTGANDSPDFLSVGIKMQEGELTRRRIIGLGVDSTQVSCLRAGTSTREECQAIATFCRKNGYKRVLLTSSLFHSRRIYSVFLPIASQNGITFYLIGAPHENFTAKNWYRNESGLLFVQNEYVKLIYYALKN